MFSATTKITDQTAKVTAAAKKGAFKSFAHTAARIRKDAIESIVREKKASKPGTPPHTRRGQLKRAILFAADATGAVIGPRKSFVGESAKAHEFGTEFRGIEFPVRPFMRPALESNLSRFKSEWKGSIE